MKRLFIILFSLVFLLILFGIYKENFIDNKKGETTVTPKPSIVSKPQSIQSILSIYPESNIVPGDPLIFTITASSTLKELVFDGKSVLFMKYKNGYIGMVGIDFRDLKSSHKVSVKLSNGMEISKTIPVTIKAVAEKPLGIPEKLGGNTEAASNALLDNIAKENISLNGVKLENKSFWTDAFRPPLAQMIVTDPYGYSRKTVGKSIAHKGTDYRAATGTDVMAINNGVVRITEEFVLSGKTIVIDHGLGVSSIYMHLSEINVNVGDSVKAGQVIAQSGETGYVYGAHLHLSIKIHRISIDPVKFFGFFK